MNNSGQIYHRREFLKFLGCTSASYFFSMGCSSLNGYLAQARRLSLPPTTKDALCTIEGLNYQILVKEGDPIGNNLRFGMNNDFIAILPSPQSDSLVMAVNHESVNPLLGFGNHTFSREKKWVDLEMQNVGVSLFSIKGSGSNFQITPSKTAFRIDANTEIPIIAPRPIENSESARGTLANCSGGTTPWGTILSCEENFADYTGDRARGKRTIKQGKNQFQWFTHYEMPPEHYGWVLEIDPSQKTAKKLTSLGRMAHEGATVTKAADGRAVVYMGDDENNQCLYKFISDSANSLNNGVLYVADLARGLWMPLTLQSSEILKRTFKDQTELLTYTREAAHIVGGTKLDRPEDIEIAPHSRDVFVCLTNNKPQNRPHGSILKILEDNRDHGSLTFKSTTFAMGGDSSGFSCPDNLTIDKNGNLWMTTDISGADIGTSEYRFAGNNSLFFIPLRGKFAGEFLRVAVAPKDAEFTGPCFSPDGDTLFLSVQHPGETTKSLSELTSHWPDGGDSVPKSAVVYFHGKTLEYLLGEDFRDS